MGGLFEFGPDGLPVVRAKVAARDDAPCCGFDGCAKPDRHRPITARPLLDCLGGNPNYSGECGLAAKDGDNPRDGLNLLSHKAIVRRSLI